MFYRNKGGVENWGQSVILYSPNPAYHEFFGSSVTIHGDNLVIGAYGRQMFTGIAYGYSRNLGGADKWGYSGSYSQPNPQHGDQAGESVASNGQYLIQGVSHATPSTAGEVIVYKLDQDNIHWNQIALISDPPPVVFSDLFGDNVDIDSTTAIIASPGRSDWTGMAYSFLLPPATPGPNSPPSSYLIIILILFVGAILLASISVLILRRWFHRPKPEQGRTAGSPDYPGLLEFSPRSDMAFIDIYSNSGNKKPNPEMASIISGSSVASDVSLVTESNRATTDTQSIPAYDAKSNVSKESPLTLRTTSNDRSTASSGSNNSMNHLPFINMPIEEWTNAQVSEWLHAIDLGRFASHMEEVNGLVLSSLTERDLQTIKGLEPIAQTALLRNVAYVKQMQARVSTSASSQTP